MPQILSSLPRLMLPILDRHEFLASLTRFKKGDKIPDIITDQAQSVVGISIDTLCKIYFWVTRNSDGTIQGPVCPMGWEHLPEEFEGEVQKFNGDNDLMAYVRLLRYAVNRESEETYLDNESCAC